MFNVMVTAGDNAWEEGAYTWDRTRILEHTEERIRDPLRDLTNESLEELAKLPTLFMYEQLAEGTPRIGTINGSSSAARSSASFLSLTKPFRR